MTINVQRNNHSDFKIIEKNKLAPRAYFIPYSKRASLAAEPLIKERYDSDMTTVLSGGWEMKFYKNNNDMPDALETGKLKYDAVNIPSTWQRTGFQPPVYLNCPYEFKTMYPKVPEDMPCAVYRKYFDLGDTAGTHILTFLGVDSCLDLYINGTFAGYSEGSHNSAEFDISSLVKKGKNEIILISFKWCNGSFLEAQDMFRENGIFRDVLLTSFPGAYVYDYHFMAQKNTSGKYPVSVDVAVKGVTSGVTVTALLTDTNGKELAHASADASALTHLDLGTPDVKEWNAEIPTVYYMYVTLSDDKGEIMSLRQVTGFRDIRIDREVFYFNDAAIKFKGVNHHDTHLTKGYAMGLDDLEKDVKLMKGLNVNAVRTSHYPPDPFFLTLADVYGLYIVDEADIETHGLDELCGNVSAISMDLKWAPRYLDRVKRMYYRDRNHPCVTMWSLGNESGGYKCQDVCYDFLHKECPQIPVHYEAVIRDRRMHYDVISEMYTSERDLKDLSAGTRKWHGHKCADYFAHPFFLCEYCHAMGVGPGGLEDYWKILYSDKRFMGGCIWEWADHTVYHENGKYRYTYGGDHGEKQHDGHFCVDGLNYADRRAHTGAREMKQVYRPLRAKAAGDGKYEFTNTNRFRSSSYIGIAWSLRVNGEETQNGTLSLDIAPQKSLTVSIAHDAPVKDKDCTLDFTYTVDGEVIATEQLILNDVPYALEAPIGSHIGVESVNNAVKVTFDRGCAIFDRATGELTSLIVGGWDYLNPSPAGDAGLLPNVFRALIDNDARKRDEWLKAGLDKIARRLTSFRTELLEDDAIVRTEYALVSGRKTLYTVKLDYDITSYGLFDVSASLHRKSLTAPDDLPRFGLTAELKHDFCDAKYYGRGPYENMPDFTAQSPVGIYSASIDDMYEKYVYPQESGMHCDVKWLELSDKAGHKIRFTADDKFGFSVHHFTQDALYRAGHQEDVADMDTTFLTIDGYLRGIGTSSCGPDTTEEYITSLKNTDHSLHFMFVPEADE